jgi:ribosomal protein S18 acetylase RimI-like enzyme
MDHDSRFSVDTYDDPPAGLCEAVDQGLEAHAHAAAPLADVRPLAVFAREGAGAVKGGAVGRTWGGCCELLQLWVAAEERRRGLGTTLLKRFEAQARSRGCTVFYLTTLSYQAPAFYRRHGYRVAAQIAGYPQGIRKFLMRRIERGAR